MCIRDRSSGESRYDKIVSMIEQSEQLKSAAESHAANLADKLVPYTLIGSALSYALTRNVTRAPVSYTHLRQDLNPIEEAEGYERLMKQFGLTQEQVAKRVVKSRSAVANALRLLALPIEVRKMCIRDRHCAVR